MLYCLILSAVMSFDLKVTRQPERELSPQLQKLNRLIDQIEHQKITLLNWQQAKSEIQQYAGQKLVPAYNAYYQTLFKQLERLWKSLSQIEFSKTDLMQVDNKIQELALSLKSNQSLTSAQADQVEEIIKYYQQQDDLLSESKSSLSKSVSLNEDETHILTSDGDWEWEQDFQSNQYQQGREQAKLKRQQDKLNQATQLTALSIKSVYLKIASMIHPDREPDETKKLEKTELLQRANEAYEQDDLFYLLKLQLDIDSNQSSTKKGLSEDQLKYYQQALASQSATLEQQIQHVIDSVVWSEKAIIAVKKSKGELNIANLYKQIDADVSVLKHQLKAEKQRLIYMEKDGGLALLLAHDAI